MAAELVDVQGAGNKYISSNDDRVCFFNTDKVYQGGLGTLMSLLEIKETEI